MFFNDVYTLQKEDPAPATMQSDAATKKRSRNQTERKHHTNTCHVLWQLARWRNLHEHELSECVYTAAADTLTPSEHDELDECLTSSAKRREDGEDK